MKASLDETKIILILTVIVITIVTVIVIDTVIVIVIVSVTRHSRSDSGY